MTDNLENEPEALKDSKEAIKSVKRTGYGDNTTPGLPFAVQAQYIKDLSFENPNAPEIYELMTRIKPKMNINIDVGTHKIEHPKTENFYEVFLTLTAQAEQRPEDMSEEEKAALEKDGNRQPKTVFLAEIVYAAAVIIQDTPSEHHHPILLAEVPRYLFPTAREILGNLTQHGYFPPLWIYPVDFHAMYKERFGKKAKESADAA